MSKEFIGRDKELSILKQSLKSKRAQIVVVRGRRRIGKSRLLFEFGKNFDKVYEFSGLPPEEGVGAKEQRIEFAELLARQAKCAVTRHDDWSHLFWLLSQQIQQEKTLIVLDEITWMAMEDKAFLAKLKNAWDLYFSRMPQLILAVSGSLSLWIKENIISSTGYLGRIDLNMKLDELPLQKYRKFWGARANISAHEILKIAMVTGGVPKYLESIDAQQTAEQNIQRLCFDSSGFLHNEFENIFSDLFSRRNQMYRNIVLTLAGGERELKDIAKALQVTKSGMLSHYLEDLEEAGFISKDFAWNIKTTKITKARTYRLRDNYSRFYLKYIFPNKERVTAESSSAVFLEKLPQLSVVFGLQFENLVLANRHLIKMELGLTVGDVVCDNPYLQRKNTKQEGCQIDYLIQTKHNVLFLCEIKFSKREIGLVVVEEVREKIKRLKVPRHFSVMPVLIHVNGVAEPVEEAGFFTQIIDFSHFV